MKKIVAKAEILIEALPYIRQFAGRTFLIKYGGKAMISEELKESFAQDIVLLKYVGINPVIVHGAGPQISEMMDRLGLKPKFVDGLRVTDKETIEVVEMVMAGSINKEIVAAINRHGGQAVGLSGKDGHLIAAQKIPPKGGVDLGFVGEIEKIHSKVLDALDLKQFIPVIAPIGISAKGETLNINADTAAAEIASTLKVEKLILLTDTPGILKGKELISTLPVKRIPEMIKKKIIVGGMIPKANCCVKAINAGVKKVHILDGSLKHAILLEIFTDKGIGTELTA